MKERKKIISVAQYEDIINSHFFMSASSLVQTHAYMCGYCRETKGNMRVSHCLHCGASLKEGFRFVGIIMNGDFLFVKEIELLHKRHTPIKEKKENRSKLRNFINGLGVAIIIGSAVATIWQRFSYPDMTQIRWFIEFWFVWMAWFAFTLFGFFLYLFDKGE